jgi:hypothetical protein
VDGPSVATIFVRLSGANALSVLVHACNGSLIDIVDISPLDPFDALRSFHHTL